MYDNIRTEQKIVDRSNQITGKNRTRTGATFQGTVDSVSGEKQTAHLSYSGGGFTSPLPMPYDGAYSWIRAIPDTGSMALLSYRVDTSETTFIRYLNDVPEKKIAGYNSGYNLYRPLVAGELEIHSSGLAQSYYSQRPSLEQRGGVIRSWLDQDSMESGQKAPIHTRQLWQHRSTNVGDEERFGVVRRPVTLNVANAALLGQAKSSNFSMYPYPDFSTPGGVPAAFSTLSQTIAAASEAAGALTGTFKVRPFAKEYLRVLKNPLYPIPPTNLIDIREGQVFDDDGVQVIGDNGAYLRAKYEYFTSLNDSTKCQIDELGNVAWSLSLGAIQGWVTQIPYGAFKLSAKAGIELRTATNIYASSTLSTSINASTELSMSSRSNMKFSTGDIGIPANFSHTTTGTHTVNSTSDIGFVSNANLNSTAGAIYNAKAGTQMNLAAPKVAIGASPSEPTVMGDTLSKFLLDLINTLLIGEASIGIGNLGAPVPLNPAIVSKLKTDLLPRIQTKTLTSKTITVSQ